MRDLFSGFGCSTGPMVSLGDGDQFDASWLRARFSGIMESDHTAEPRAERVVAKGLRLCHSIHVKCALCCYCRPVKLSLLLSELYVINVNSVNNGSLMSARFGLLFQGSA